MWYSITYAYIPFSLSLPLGKSFKDYIQSLGHGKNDHRVANHGMTSGTSQSHAPSHSAAKKDNSRNIESGPIRTSVTSSGNKKVLLETPSGPRGIHLIQGPQPKVLEPNQELSNTHHVGSNQKTSSDQGTSATNLRSTKPLTTTSAHSSSNGQAGMTAQVSGSGQVPGSTINNVTGSNPAQMPYQYQMYSSGAPRGMILPSGMRPMVPFRPALGRHQQNMSQHPVAPHLYGMHPGNFYNALFWQQQASAAAAAGQQQVPVSVHSSVSEPNGKEGQANMAGHPLLSTTVEAKSNGSEPESKKAGSNNVNLIEDSKSKNKTIASGRRNYTVATQSEEKMKKVSAGVSANGGKKDGDGGDDSGLGVEMGSSSMNSSTTSGAGLLIHTSAGAPRFATKVVETDYKSKI